MNKEKTAQEIQDYFFERGARIKKQDWDWLLDKIEQTYKQAQKQEEVKWAEKLAQAEVRSYKAGREDYRQQIKQKLKDLKGIDKETLKDIFKVIDEVDN
jgi:response regulator of citrate/malate metabolism